MNVDVLMVVTVEGIDVCMYGKKETKKKGKRKKGHSVTVQMKVTGSKGVK